MASFYFFFSYTNDSNDFSSRRYIYIALYTHLHARVSTWKLISISALEGQNSTSEKRKENVDIRPRIALISLRRRRARARVGAGGGISTTAPTSVRIEVNRPPWT